MDNTDNGDRAMTVEQCTDALIRVAIVALLSIMFLDIPVTLWVVSLGGMVSAGFIGLFTGAVILAVGYQVFMQWVATKSEHERADQAEAPEET